MNELPPANLNALKGVLGRAQALIERDSNNVPETRSMNEALPPRSEMNKGMIESDQLISADQLPDNAQVYAEKPIPQMNMPVPQMNESLNYSNQMVDNSNFSPEVKAAMKEHNLSQIDTQSFNIDDMGDLVKPQLNEQAQPNVGVNEQQLRKIIREELMTILSGEFTKKIRESTIKSTIQTLIKEGKVTTTVKKKPRK